MYKTVVLLTSILGSGLNAQAITIVNIGGIVKNLTSSTSCQLRDWKTQSNSCTCCLVKHSLFDKSKNPFNAAINACFKKSHCKSQTISELNPNKLTPTEFITTLNRSAIQNPRVAVNKEDIQIKGKLSPAGAVNLITMAVQNKIITQYPHTAMLKNPNCVKAKALGGGGAQTAQLFLISTNPSCMINRLDGEFKPTYILKETKKKSAEVKNLRQLAMSSLRYFDLQNPARSEYDLAIAFDVQNFVYTTGIQTHYLTLLEIAPGASLTSLVQKLAEAGKNYRQNNPSSISEYNSSYNTVHSSFYKLGFGLSRLHQYFMKGENNNTLKTPTMVHGDLHMGNIYSHTENKLSIDLLRETKVTLIDTETFAAYINKPGLVAIDLLILYGFSTSHLSSQHRIPGTIDQLTWHQVMLKPFLIGYIKAWPKQKQGQIWHELKEMFLTGVPQTKVKGRRLLALDIIRYKTITDKYAKPIFDEIAKELDLNPTQKPNISIQR